LIAPTPPVEGRWSPGQPLTFQLSISTRPTFTSHHITHRTQHKRETSAGVIDGWETAASVVRTSVMVSGSFAYLS
jgi:hypothetical protein